MIDLKIKACGLTRQSISMIENSRRIPSITSCLKVSKGLGMTLQKLLDMTEKRIKKS